jgi:hypothetical protein
MKIFEEANALAEGLWSGEVLEKWHPPEGFFKRSAQSIATDLKSASKDLRQAMARLNFYMNRAGDNLSSIDGAKIESAKKILHSLY